jgi:cysteine desulfurase
LRKPVYLDYAATTPVAPEVAAEMQACLTLDGCFANPASRSHIYGWQAEEKVEEARLQVANLINADSREIVWTSGATEANNLALKGIAENYRQQHSAGGHILVSSIEHKAVLDVVSWLETRGFSVTRVAPNEKGIIEPETLETNLRADTFLVSVMHVNNELGSINDIAAISQITRARKIILHCDAAQSAGKIAMDVKALGVDLLSLSAHKFYGPKGIGALYVRRAGDIKVASQIHGGGHERNMRSGTLATHQCVGMGAAAELAQRELIADNQRIAKLRDRLWQGLADLPHIRRNSVTKDATKHSVSGILNIAFAKDETQGCDGETLLLSLRNLAVSSGSACNSASMSPSYVLKAIGLSDAQAQASLRFSLGRYTTPEEIDFAINEIRAVVNQLQKNTVNT